MVRTKKDKKISILLEDLTVLESYVRDIFTFSPLPFCFMSPGGVILEANPAFIKISNFSFNEIVGKSAEELFGKKETEEIMNRALKDGFINGKEIFFFPKSRDKIFVQIFAKTRKEKNGENIGYFLCIFDLTEIKKKEMELEERIMELEKFHELTIDRELKMVELKKKIEELKKNKSH